MDANENKKLIVVNRLSDSQVPFIDTGIGLVNDTAGLGGLIRVTTSLPGKRAHIDDGQLLSYAPGEADEYESNTRSPNSTP